MAGTACLRCGRPRLLDLFCCAGGAGAGYHRAGFCVTGVDRAPQPRYPHRFIRGDALQVLAGVPSGMYAAVHASPPCQAYTKGAGRWGTRGDHSDLIGPVRDLLLGLRVPYVIENVDQSLVPLRDPVRLCGTMFGRRITWQGECRELRRHRLFETNWSLAPPAPCDHRFRSVPVHGNPGGRSARDGISFPGADGWRELMGMPWATARECAEAIPPVYAEHVGRQLMAHLNMQAVA